MLGYVHCNGYFDMSLSVCIRWAAILHTNHLRTVLLHIHICYVAPGICACSKDSWGQLKYAFYELGTWMLLWTDWTGQLIVDNFAFQLDFSSTNYLDFTIHII